MPWQRKKHWQKSRVKALCERRSFRTKIVINSKTGKVQIAGIAAAKAGNSFCNIQEGR